MRILWILLLGVLGFVFLGMAVSNYFSYREIERKGKVAVVQPFEKYLVSTRTTKKLGITISEDKTIRADITFRDENNRAYTLPSRVIPEEEMKKFQQGAQVTIKFIPSDPYGKNRFPSEDMGVFWVALLGLGSLFSTYWLLKNGGGERNEDEVRI